MFKAGTWNNPVEVGFILLGKIFILKSCDRDRKIGRGRPAAVMYFNTQ